MQGRHGYDPGVTQRLAEIDVDHYWYAPRRRLIVGLLNQFFPHARRFLEVGCGTGATISEIAKSRKWDLLVGSDFYCDEFENIARRCNEVCLIQIDARQIPMTAGCDVIGAFDVIEHIVEDERVLASMRETATQGVILTVPQHPFLWSNYDEHFGHVRRYRRGELERKLCHAGFSIAFTGSYTSFLFPLMVAARFTPRRKHAKLGIEFQPPAAINAALRWTLNAEVSATLAGARFPFGGSRIVVATV